MCQGFIARTWHFQEHGLQSYDAKYEKQVKQLDYQVSVIPHLNQQQSIKLQLTQKETSQAMKGVISPKKRENKPSYILHLCWTNEALDA